MLIVFEGSTTQSHSIHTSEQQTLDQLIKQSHSLTSSERQKLLHQLIEQSHSVPTSEQLKMYNQVLQTTSCEVLQISKIKDKKNVEPEV